MRCFALVLAALVLFGCALAEPRKSKGVVKILAKEEEKAAASASTAEMAVNERKSRKGKVFSLFNVVYFNNGGCQSQSTFTSGGLGQPTRNGTCFTSEECSAKGGTASGNCAAGFGVCCIFLVSTSGSTISQNCTYIRNPGFPSSYSGDAATTYTIKKMSDNICKLRLDFDSFTIQGTGNSREYLNIDNQGGTCLDTFQVTVNTGQQIPTICGANTGQHMYIDIGNDASDTATLNFAFDVLAGTQGIVGTSTTLATIPDYTGTRQWEIKVTQIPCYGCCANCYQAPPLCLQYHTGLTGSFNTFNYAATDDSHLANQDYNICIRQEAGYCCIQYAPCAADGSQAWSIDVGNLDTTEITANDGVSAIDSTCSGDYIDIAGSNANCNQGGSRVPVVNKYCGQFFNAIAGLSVSSTVCDCTQPFNVQIHTDALTDKDIVNDATNAPNFAQSRGVCLTYMQIPCAS